jgi:DNA-binding transcriptional ArsR family regulator
MKRGRPLKSEIRQNIVEILYVLGEGYAYQIYKIYAEIFAQVTMRSVYHHLRKGVSTQEFIVKAIKKEQGQYSWGTEVEKTYYALGPAASPKALENVREYFQNKK